MHRKLFTGVFACLLLATTAFSIEGAPLTLDDCFTRAKAHSDALRAAAERRTQAGERVRQAKGGLLPDVRFRFDKTYRDSDGGTVAGETTDGRFAVTQPLFYGFRHIGDVALTQTEQKRADLALETVYLQLRADVAQAFYTVASLDADIRNVHETVLIMQNRVKELKERVRLGKSRESEVLVVESQIAALQSQEEQIFGNRAKALDTLAALTGIPQESLSIRDTLAPVEKAEPLDIFLAAVPQRPDVRSSDEAIQAQKYRVAIAKGLLLPTLDLGADWYLARSGSLANSDWDIGLFLDVPLYTGCISRSRVRETEAGVKELAAQKDLLTLNITTDVRRLYRDLTSSIKQAAALKEAYNKAERSYQLQMRDYRLGLVNNLDVLQAISAALDAKRNLDRALIQTELSKIFLDIAAGR
jgi:outer membrane protein TolC